MAAFPLNDQQDSAQYSESAEDVALREKMEGGYTYTRPKFTRKARKTFKTGFTDLIDSDKLVLQAFWDTVKGGSEMFTWLNPVTNVTYNVRFMKPLMYQYVGRGGVHRWNVVGIELEEV